MVTCAAQGSSRPGLLMVGAAARRPTAGVAGTTAGHAPDE
jgi:hypothetical protein